MESAEECSICGCYGHKTSECPEMESETGIVQLPPSNSLARQTLPSTFKVSQCGSDIDVVSSVTIGPRTKFGPLFAKHVTEPIIPDANKLQLEILDKNGIRTYMDLSNENECNWLSLVKPASYLEEQNCIAFQLDNQIYYSTSRKIASGETLKVWYAKGYAKKLGKPLAPSALAQTVHCAEEMAEIVGQNVAAFEEAEHSQVHTVHETSATQAQPEVIHSSSNNRDIVSHAMVVCSESQRTGNNIIEQSIVASQAFDITEQDDLQMLECQLLYACHLCPDVTRNDQQELEDHMMSVHRKTHKQSMSELVNVDTTPAEAAHSTVLVEEVTKRSKGLDCKQCNYKASSTSSLAVHITTEHLSGKAAAVTDMPLPPKKRVWACSKCGVVFSNPRSLGVHKRIHHPPPVEHVESEKEQSSTEEVREDTTTINVVIEQEPEPTEKEDPKHYGRGKRKRNKPKRLDGVNVDAMLDCPHCTELLPNETALNEHMSITHSFQCDKCSIKFSSGQAYMKHLCRESLLIIDISQYCTTMDDNNSYYTCLCCEQNYTDPREFHDHLVWQGVNLQCDICKGYCVKVEELELHVVSCTGSNEVDQSSLTHPCPHCHVLLVNDLALQSHLAMHLNYKCNHCGTQYLSRFGLQKHLLICDQSQLDRVRPVFACLQCEAVFATQHGLEYHNKDHTELTFDCKDCQTSFSLQEEFEGHECKADLYPCDICKETFKSRKSLTTHYLTHTLNFDCLICTKSFDKKEDLIKHSLECSAKDMLDKTGRINCAHCEESFTDTAQYRSHLSVHTHFHECKHCNRRFRKKQQLNLHISRCPLRADRPRRKPKDATRRIHHISSEVHHTCPICNRSYVRKDYYLNHQCRGEDGRVIPRPDNLQLIDDTDTSQHKVCYQCGKIFSSQSNLTKHLKMHGEKDNTCEVCGKSFYQVHAMKLHYDTVHTDKLKVTCEQCKRVFRNKYSLQQHMKQFHTSAVSLYACEICGKKFRQKGNMMKHMLAHDATKHYSCGYCEKTFRYPEQLKRHVVLHTQGKSLACHLCDRRFVIQHELNKHLKEMHNNKLYVCAFCHETCRWKHTIRRHIKRKHPQFAAMANDTTYLMSLQKDIEQCEMMNRLMIDGQVNNPTPLVISVDSLTAEQMAELAEEQIGQADNGSTIQLYTEQGELQATDVQKQLSNLQSQQLVMNNTQHFTINLSTGQAILTQVNLDDGRVNSSSILRSSVAPDVDGLNEQSNSQVVVEQSDQVSLPENTVILTNDGSIAYSNEHRQDMANTVNFSDITHITDNSQEDGNKMMFFNIIPSGGEPTVTQ